LFCERINQLQIKLVYTNTLNLKIFTLEDAHYETFQIPQINNTDWLSREFLMHQAVYSPSLYEVRSTITHKYWSPGGCGIACRS